MRDRSSSRLNLSISLYRQIQDSEYITFQHRHHSIHFMLLDIMTPLSIAGRAVHLDWNHEFRTFCFLFFLFPFLLKHSNCISFITMSNWRGKLASTLIASGEYLPLIFSSWASRAGGGGGGVIVVFFYRVSLHSPIVDPGGEGQPAAARKLTWLAVSLSRGSLCVFSVKCYSS